MEKWNRYQKYLLWSNRKTILHTYISYQRQKQPNSNFFRRILIDKPTILNVYHENR